MPSAVSLTCPECYARLVQLGRGGPDGKWSEINAYRCQRCLPGHNKFKVVNGVMTVQPYIVPMEVLRRHDMARAS